MKLNFTGGTATQRGMWEQAIERLLTLPLEALPLTINVSFVDPAEVAVDEQNALAVTTWTYDDTTSNTKVRNDAPGFGSQRKALVAQAASMGLIYNGEVHFNETAAHELGHSAFAALPQEKRVAIAEMFGAKSDDIDELSAGAKWENRIIEGIADTFKEAFLPRRFRVFPNRTKRRIPYGRYSEFRAIFREGVEGIGGVGTPVPAYDLNVYGGYHAPEHLQVYQPEPSEILWTGGTFFKGDYEGGIYKQIEGWEPPLEADDNYLYKQYKAQSVTDILLVPHGTHFAGSITLPQDIDFYGPSADPAPIHGAAFGGAGFAGAFTWEEIHNNKELEDPFGQFNYPFGDRMLGLVAADIWFTYWKPPTKSSPPEGTWVPWDYKSGSIIGFEPQYKFGNPHPNFPGPNSERFGCWIIMKGDGRANMINEGDKWSIPIGTLSLSSDVPSSAPTIETCGGDMVQVRIFAKVTLKTGVSKQDSPAAIHSRLPSFTLTRGAKICKGQVIDLPSPLLQPEGATAGARPHRRPVSGNRR